MFRQLVFEMLGKRPELRVVVEASDGLEALQKAVALRPDLIPVDISLPRLYGIDVARQMRSFAPESKIAFFTQESTTELVQEALGLGARDYVTKNVLLADLFAAVDPLLSARSPALDSSVGELISRVRAIEANSLSGTVK